jgi:hypothetical protein
MPTHFTKQQMDQIGRIAGLASKLQDRCDSFMSRRAQREADKAARRADKARRDAELDPATEALKVTPGSDLTIDPNTLPEHPWFDDAALHEERDALRTGGLSKRD